APLIQYGASPRAPLGLVRATRALPLLRGRDYALPQDVQDAAPDILRHHHEHPYRAPADDIPPDHIAAPVPATVPLPTVAPRQSAVGPPVPSGSPVAPHSPARPPAGWPGFGGQPS